MDGFTGCGLACIRSERIVFAGLNFSVAPGGALLLTGPNGSGKSSLLRLMAGISHPAAGKISWRGKSIADEPEGFFRDLHYIGHRDAIKPALSVRENLEFFSALRPGTRDIGGALERMGLAPLADLPARTLSAGQTRRVALARILACPAPLWLLDEPTVALDQASVDRLQTAISTHRRSGGIVVASTNVPLEIDDATSMDVSACAYVGETVWGDPA